MKKEKATTSARKEVQKRVQQLRKYEQSHPEMKHYSLQDLEKRMMCSEVRTMSLKKMNDSIKAGNDRAMREAKLTNEKMQREIRSIDAKYS